LNVLTTLMEADIPAESALSSASSPLACATDNASIKARADKCIDQLCAVQLLGSMSFAVLMQAQTGLIYRLARGNTQLAIQVISNLSSASALLAFLISPALGRLSDIYGRKPFISIFPLLVALTRSATALRPSWSTLVLGNLLTATTSPVFFASIQAAVADTHLPLGSSAIAVASARIQTWMGMAMMLGPILGGQLASISLRLPFAVSAAFGAANVLWLQHSFEETRGGVQEEVDSRSSHTKMVRERKATGVNAAVAAAAVERFREKGGEGCCSCSSTGETFVAAFLSPDRLL
jgi:MFS family permease